MPRELQCKARSNVSRIAVFLFYEERIEVTQRTGNLLIVEILNSSYLLPFLSFLLVPEEDGGESKPKSLKGKEMALNPQLFPNGMPVPFVHEIFVLARDGVEFEIDKIPGAQGGNLKTKGIVYLSNIRMVFVANKSVGNFVAFDLPLLYVHGEKFNQPIFFCNNISGMVDPVVPENEHRALYSTHSFKLLFKEGGCGTFIPLFFNLIASVRSYNQHASAAAQIRLDPLQAAQTPVDEMMRHAYVDPNDPTRIFLQQPNSEPQLRRRTYQSQNGENST